MMLSVVIWSRRDNESLVPSDAERRLLTTAMNPVYVRRVKKLVVDFELGLVVEAALLLMGAALLSELLSSETELRRMLHGMADSGERI